MIGEICALGAAVCWALTSVLIRSQLLKMDVLSLNTLRCLFACFFFVLWVTVSGKIGGLTSAPGPSLVLLAVSGIMSLGLGDTIFFQSQELIGTARALAISGVHPLFTLLLALLFLDEHVTWLMALGILLIIVGTYLLSSPTVDLSADRGAQLRGENRKGVHLALAAAALWGLAPVLLKLGLDGLDEVLANAFRLLIVSIFLVGWIAYKGGNFQLMTHGRNAVLIVAVAGIVGTGLTSQLVLWGIQLAGAAKTAALTSSAPLFGMPLSLLLLREKITWKIVVGTVLCVVGVWLVL
jgi:drug/metabolite transporter (DMT)-like permease